MNHLSKLFDRTLNTFAWLAVLIIIATMFGVIAEVVLRKTINYSIVGIVEITEYGLLFLTFLGTAWLLREEGHVRVEIFFQMMKPKVRAVLEIINSFICMIATAALTYFGWEVTMDFLTRGTKTATVLQLPRAYLVIIIPFGSLFLAIQFARRLVHWYKELKKLNAA